MFTNYYEHCDQHWQATWDCACNDRCPECNKEIEPYESQEDDQFDWDCPSCGRHFEDMTREELATGCPSDDCPSHWEELGLPYPEK